MKIPVSFPWIVLAAVGALTAISAAAHAPTRLTADLKSFLHGEPAMPPKAAPPKVTAVVSTAPGQAPDAQIEDFFRAFAEALKAREGSRMTSRLSDKYTIADLPEDRKASEFFAQAVDRTPGPETIVIQSVTLQGTDRLVKVALKFPAKTSLKTFQFDASGRLLASDLFMLKRVEHGM